MSRDLYYRVGITAPGTTYDLSRDLGSITVEQRASQPAKAAIELSDPFKVLGHALQPGMQVEVELGTADDHALVFLGKIYQVNAAFPDAGVPRLTVLAYDGTMAMGLRERNRPFRDVTLSQVVRRVAAASPYRFASMQVEVVGDPAFPGNGVRQREETDLAFLLRLAAAYGCQMAAMPGDAGESFEFKAERLLMDGEPEVTLYLGRCDVPDRLLSFTPSSDVGRIQLPRVLAGIEYETGNPISAAQADDDDVGDLEDPFADENVAAFAARHPDRAPGLTRLIGAGAAARSALEQDMGSVRREVVTTFSTPANLAERLRNQFSMQRLGMQASGVALGNYRLRAQRSVSVLDVGGQFSGKWFLTEVRHTVNRTAFRTEFECRR